MKKKKPVSELTVQPILEPIEYAGGGFTIEKRYQERYAAWRGWYKDIIISLEENGSRKRRLYALDQMILHLNELADCLREEKQQPLWGLISQTEEIKLQVDQPNGFINANMVRKNLETIEAELRHEFSFSQVKDYLIVP